MATPKTPGDDRPEHADDTPWAELAAPEGTAVGVCVGNSRTKLGLIDGLGVRHARAVDSSDADAASAALGELLDLADHENVPETVLLASSNNIAADQIARGLAGRGRPPVVRLGTDLPIPMAMEVAEPSRVGHDRLLSALGAFHRARQACIVVDAGTAVTVDFVDGRGVFHGGAILPGGQLMLRALHDHTDALPKLSLSDMPDPLEPFGRSSEHAMLLGAKAGVCGAVRFLAERYAEFYEAYPHIIATGGEAPLLFAQDDLIEALVPDLELLGVAVARARLASDPEP